MKRRKRTEILINGSRELAKKIADDVKNKYEVKTIEQPNFGVIMTQCRESGKKSTFYLGEVLVTECKVSINGKMGLGIVQGEHEQLAYELAIIDAAYANDDLNKEHWNAWLLEEEQSINEQAQKEAKRILATKVDFSTMNVDV